jgi:pimeloyl-ACP methyl ester carboxylesterase
MFAKGPSEPPTDDAARILRSDHHLIRDVYPRTDGQKCRLGDGRLMGYGVYGNPAAGPARTIVFMHGTPGTRFFFHENHHKEALKAGVRVLVPERPGFGLSTFQAVRSMQSHADDVVELLKLLGLEAVSAVVGYSAGGPYALAFARFHPKVVTGCVAVVSSLSPPIFDKMDDVTIGMSGLSRLGYFVSRRAPWLLRLLVRFLSRSAVKDIFEPKRDELCAVDSAKFRADVGIRRLFAASTLELYAREGGARAEADDYVIISADDWGFDLSDLPKDKRAFIYGGAMDVQCTPNMYKAIVRGVPNVAEASHLAPGKGHLYFYELFPSLIRDIGLGPPPVSARSGR